MKCFSDQKFDLAEATFKLGEEWYSKHVGFKLFPCCHYSHTYILTVLDMLKKEKIDPEDIKKIIAYGTERYRRTICSPNRYEPKSVMAAQFSLPYIVASAIRDNKIDLDTFTEGKMRDRETLNLASKLELVVDPEMEKKFGKVGKFEFIQPAKLTIITKDGKEHTGDMETEPPPTREFMRGKFINQARRILPEDKVNEIISTVAKLEELKDISDLIKLTYK